MKYIVTLVITTIFLWTQSCKSEEIDPNVSGKVIEGGLNGKTWQNTNFRIGYSGNCTKSIFLGIWVKNENKFKRESFSIHKIPLRKDNFEIIRYEYSKDNCLDDFTISTKEVMATYFTQQDGGDVIKDTYSVLDNPKEKNRLTITKLDLTNKYIEGEFDATFLLKRDDNGNKFYKDSPDTLRFKGVKFQASIVNLM
jgi:hypothetical protein